MSNLNKFLIIFGILILILGQGGILGAFFGFIIALFRIPAFVGILIIGLAIFLHYNKRKEK